MPTALIGGRAILQLTSTQDPPLVAVRRLSLILEGKHFSFKPAIQAITGTLDL